MRGRVSSSRARDGDTEEGGLGLSLYCSRRDMRPVRFMILDMDAAQVHVVGRKGGELGEGAVRPEEMEMTLPINMYPG